MANAAKMTNADENKSLLSAGADVDWQVDQDGHNVVTAKGKLDVEGASINLEVKVDASDPSLEQVDLNTRVEAGKKSAVEFGIRANAELREGAAYVGGELEKGGGHVTGRIEAGGSAEDGAFLGGMVGLDYEGTPIAEVSGRMYGGKGDVKAGASFTMDLFDNTATINANVEVQKAHKTESPQIVGIGEGTFGPLTYGANTVTTFGRANTLGQNGPATIATQRAQTNLAFSMLNNDYTLSRETTVTTLDEDYNVSTQTLEQTGLMNTGMLSEVVGEDLATAITEQEALQAPFAERKGTLQNYVDTLAYDFKSYLGDDVFEAGRGYHVNKAADEAVDFAQTNNIDMFGFDFQTQAEALYDMVSDAARKGESMPFGLDEMGAQLSELAAQVEEMEPARRESYLSNFASLGLPASEALPAFTAQWNQVNEFSSLPSNDFSIELAVPEVPENFDVTDIKITGVPEGSFLSAGMSNYTSPSDAALLDGLTSYYKGNRARAAQEMWDTPAPTATPGYKTDTFTANDKSLYDVANRNGMSVNEVIALNRDKITRNGNVEVGQTLTVHDTFDEPSSPSRSSSAWGKAPDAGYPSQEYTKVDNPVSMADINAYLDSFRDQVNPSRSVASKAASKTTKEAAAPIAIGKASRFNRPEETESQPMRSSAPKTTASPTSYASAFVDQNISSTRGAASEVTTGTTKGNQSLLGTPDESLGQSRAAKGAVLKGELGGFDNDDAANENSRGNRNGAGRQEARDAVTQIAMGSGASGRSTGYADRQAVASALTKSGQHGNVSPSDLTEYGTLRGSEQTSVLSEDAYFAPDAFKNTQWNNKTQTGKGGGDSGRDSRVICTELVRQGLMKAKLQRLDIAFTFKHLSPATVRGYHFWAVPYVRLMKRSKLATRFVEPFARWRAEEIAYQMGAVDKANLKGKLVRLVGEPICWGLGLVLGWIGDPDRFYPVSTKG